MIDWPRLIRAISGTPEPKPVPSMDVLAEQIRQLSEGKTDEQKLQLFWDVDQIMLEVLKNSYSTTYIQDDSFRGQFQVKGFTLIKVGQQ